MKIIVAIQILIKLFTIGYGAGAVRTTGRFTAPAAAGKRADTCGFYPLNSRFPLFPSLAQTRDRRPLRNRGTAEFFTTVSFSTYSQCQTAYYYTYGLLCAGAAQGELPVGQERVPWGMTVPHKSLTRYIVGRGDLTPPFFTICCHLHTAGWGHPALQDRFCNG